MPDVYGRESRDPPPPPLGRNDFGGAEAEASFAGQAREEDYRRSRSQGRDAATKIPRLLPRNRSYTSAASAKMSIDCRTASSTRPPTLPTTPSAKASAAMAAVEGSMRLSAPLRRRKLRQESAWHHLLRLTRRGLHLLRPTRRGLHRQHRPRRVRRASRSLAPAHPPRVAAAATFCSKGTACRL